MLRCGTLHSNRNMAHTPSKGILFAAGMLVLSLTLPTSAARAQAQWTVFYVVLNGGFGWTGVPSDIAYFGTDPGGVFLVNRDEGFDARGGFFGLQIGHNWQSGRVVFGIEGDMQLSDIRDSFTQTVGPQFDFEIDTFLGILRIHRFGTV